MTLPRYKVRVSPQANAEIDDLYHFIADECFQQETADKYMEGIYATIVKLAWLGGIIGVSLNRNLRREYGASVRTISYKKMTIIYTVHGNLVAVHRVIAGRNIK
ncbi:MAG: type II toxin-antitoxin system RelE/ParE family toxin [Prevotellaceae bacterium]|jgi:plasmid stabilization system protein ParE|nr:type II toxin-antitoxin system RelE/ParE family toxin [Prevotellaceae bacterium]